MGLTGLMRERMARDEGPIRVALVGAGKFGAMFLAQAPTSPGIRVVAIADLDPARARRTLESVGWRADRIDAVRIGDDAEAVMAADDVEVVVEATGDPWAGLRHARAAHKAGKHVVMVNVEADVLAGPLLAREAKAAGVVHSMAYGDQPALICELVDWARACGFEVTAAGKGTKYLPGYHESTPETVWDHYGISGEQAAAGGMNPRMFNSFLDGTKSAIEMAAVANATGLAAPVHGLGFPPSGVDDLPHTLRPRAMGGQLDGRGMVEVVSSLERDGRPVFRDLRWGVYVTLEAPTNYAGACFRQYGLLTDPSGRFAAMYKPFHLIGMELNVSILSAVLRREPTGTPRQFSADVVAVAKRDLAAGETLDGEGGFTVWGRLTTARRSLSDGALPIGLAHGVRLTAPVRRGEVVRQTDVALDEAHEAVALRRALEADSRATLGLDPLPTPAPVA
ncbi:flagellar biosynthesis protein FlgA [Roseospira marina]|uniref:Flagellar biosynthesis protein FlgA n=1 Tax=Roseospira marina TaxID=140057 RepID=A0A5M6I9P0_9PROT|nr:Gfo/Idh/MocA family oxidoreductase [Roseospira marina]KAA5604913.1 flagellar biosynthesis protein FlgA [Roseospira marina]MBB4315253.1 putative homoserine dehydrogenase-like protein [Roseospira marina]MBB5088253.1 putative homoserine dehydrogenase-like protein [Roseospira marina]